jgi:hypothetical protein
MAGRRWIMTQSLSQLRLTVTGADDASQLVIGILQVLAALHSIVETETDLIRQGRLREGLEQEPEKTALAGTYMTGLETLKANAIALSRFAPQDVIRFREAHQDFAAALEMNQTVLATARAISENLVRSLAEEATKLERPITYGKTGQTGSYASRTEPVLLSKQL